ncbi:MAG: hypothetical protein H0T74_06865 [Rubrobacteraceae bacterium]|nr:hypothetical protein [Rubrobacteraceae bacterium]
MTELLAGAYTVCGPASTKGPGDERTEPTMIRRFESLVIVVTGIGRAVDWRVASKGVVVVIGARREDVGRASRVVGTVPGFT